jgi:hypothetical protein
MPTSRQIAIPEQLLAEAGRAQSQLLAEVSRAQREMLAVGLEAALDLDQFAEAGGRRWGRDHEPQFTADPMRRVY